MIGCGLLPLVAFALLVSNVSTLNISFSPNSSSILCWNEEQQSNYPCLHTEHCCGAFRCCSRTTISSPTAHEHFIQKHFWLLVAVCVSILLILIVAIIAIIVYMKTILNSGARKKPQDRMGAYQHPLFNTSDPYGLRGSGPNGHATNFSFQPALKSSRVPSPQTTEVQIEAYNLGGDLAVTTSKTEC